MGIFQNRVRWLLIFLMFIISAISYLDRVNISIAVQPIEQSFHLSDIQFGWVFSAWVLGYALFQAPSGRMADKFGPRRILALGTIWWAIFTAMTALVPSDFAGALIVLMGVRFLLGIGESVVYPASNRLVASWIPSTERGIANGLIFAGVGAGAGITPRLITYVMVNYGWRWSFWISALIGLIAGVIWFIVARDKPSQHSWVSAEEATIIQAGLPQADKHETAKPLPWRRILTNRNVLTITASYFCYGYVAYIFFSWFFNYLSRVRGLNLKSSSYYGMLPFIAMAICSPLGGWISDRLVTRVGERRGRCGVAFVGMALAGIFVAMGPQARDARLASIILAGGAGALYLAQSAFWSITSEIAGQSAGSVSGVMNMGNQIAGAVTASLTPFIAKKFNWEASFVVAAALAIIGSLLWLFVDPERDIAASPRQFGASASR
jgi:ACS family glucarate transporter-like MFS transporter